MLSFLAEDVVTVSDEIPRRILCHQKAFSGVVYVCLNHADEFHRNGWTILSRCTQVENRLSDSPIWALTTFICYSAVWWKVFLNETLVKGDKPANDPHFCGKAQWARVGIEPHTPRLQGICTNHLTIWPNHFRGRRMKNRSTLSRNKSWVG